MRYRSLWVLECRYCMITAFDHGPIGRLLAFVYSEDSEISCTRMTWSFTNVYALWTPSEQPLHQSNTSSRISFPLD